ncbi:MAG: hypothetical protein BZ138_06100 [Methanosphaera sp. rholeuAM270]|nr:MAG: hypothetical protein BZ138_06100 [Methanosphaera sp. rholeuAM270]
MEEILEINGIKYIKQERVKQQEKELEKLKATLSKVFGELSEYIEHDVIIHEEIEPKPKRKTPKKYNRGHEPFHIAESAKQRWNIFKMDNDGHFWGKTKQKFRVTIREVLIVKNSFNRTVTQNEARQIQEKTGLNFATFHRLVYNVCEEKIFDKYIKQWNQITRPPYKKKTVEVQNNPQKRKEMGYC